MLWSWDDQPSQWSINKFTIYNQLGLVIIVLRKPWILCIELTTHVYNIYTLHSQSQYAYHHISAKLETVALFDMWRTSFAYVIYRRPCRDQSHDQCPVFTEIEINKVIENENGIPLKYNPSWHIYQHCIKYTRISCSHLQIGQPPHNSYSAIL